MNNFLYIKLNRFNTNILLDIKKSLANYNPTIFKIGSKKTKFFFSYSYKLHFSTFYKDSNFILLENIINLNKNKNLVVTLLVFQNNILDLNTLKVLNYNNNFFFLQCFFFLYIMFFMKNKIYYIKSMSNLITLFYLF